MTAAPDEHLYSVNLLTGSVLLDGSPPRSLPGDVLSHPLYVRTFGDRDFEISVAGNGALRTERPLNGCFYEFFLQDDRLGVVELPADGAAGDRLELLDGTDDAALTWGVDLPVRLRELHSHWLCRGAGVLLVRSRVLPKCDISFVILLRGGAAAEAAAARHEGDHPAKGGDLCVRVPSHMRGAPWRELVAHAARGDVLTDALVLWDVPPAPPLLKLEDQRFVHWYRGSDGAFRVELPRFKREFMLRSGALVSADYAGYRLAAEQQRPDTLLQFTMYLVLEPGPELFAQHPWRASVKLLVPVSCVERTPEGVPVVTHTSDASDARRGCWTYDVHDRFRELRARSVPARLQLAALYAAADASLSEPFSSMSGAEMAIMLVRRCFLSRALTVQEVALCDAVARLSRGTPALRLLCHHLSSTGAQLDFMAVSSASRDDDDAQKRLANSATEYLLYVKRGSCNARLLLEPYEEERILGARAGPQPPRARMLRSVAAPVVHLPPPPVEASYVVDAELRLRKMVVFTTLSEEPPRECPLTVDQLPADARDELGREMLGELADSWDVHERQPQEQLCKYVRTPAALRAKVASELQQATRRRVAAEHLPTGRSDGVAAARQRARLACQRATAATCRRACAESRDAGVCARALEPVTRGRDEHLPWPITGGPRTAARRHSRMASACCARGQAAAHRAHCAGGRGRRGGR